MSTPPKHYSNSSQIAAALTPELYQQRTPKSRRDYMAQGYNDFQPTASGRNQGAQPQYEERRQPMGGSHVSSIPVSFPAAPYSPAVEQSTLARPSEFQASQQPQAWQQPQQPPQQCQCRFCPRCGFDLGSYAGEGQNQQAVQEQCQPQQETGYYQTQQTLRQPPPMTGSQRVVENSTQPLMQTTQQPVGLKTYLERSGKLSAAHQKPLSEPEFEYFVNDLQKSPDMYGYVVGACQAVVLTVPQLCAVLREFNGDQIRMQLVLEIRDRVWQIQAGIDRICELINSKQMKYELRRTLTRGYEGRIQ